MKITQTVTKVVEYIALRPWRILGLALVLSIAACWATVHLPIHTSRQSLLPQDTDVARRFNAFLKNFGAAADLIVVLEGAPRGELEAFATELAARLRVEPEVGQATDRLDMGFFLEHAYLLMPAERLDRLASMTHRSFATDGGLEEHLRAALKWSKNHPPLSGMDIDLQSAKETLNLAAYFLEEWQRWLSAEKVPEGMDWNRLLSRYGAGGMVKGYFSSRDGQMLFVFVHPKNPSEDFKSIGPFVEKVRQVSADLTKQFKASGHTPPTLGLTGLPAIEFEEFVSIRKDITLVIFTSAGLIATLILVVVRSLRWAALIFIPMGMGVLWSLGLALVTVGHLTIITAAFIAILFGLGADYGIFTSSRIDEERRDGKPLIQAISAGIGSSFGAVLTAGGASLLIFGTLAMVDFPGFAELGVIAAKGVLMILVATWMVQPALYVLLPPKLKPAPSKNSSPRHGKQPGTFPKPVALFLVVVALGCAAIGVSKGLAIPFNYDVLAMLPRDSQAAEYQRRMVAESDYQAEVVIFTAKDMAEARRITAEADKLKTIAQVQSLTHLFPIDADERLRKAVRIGRAFANAGYHEQIETLEREGLSTKSFEMLQAFLENGVNIIDEAEEQAFSAGHGDLVESLESVRSGVSAIRAKLAEDGERGRTRSELFLRGLLGGADTALKTIDTWREGKPLQPDQLPPTLRDRFFGADGSVAVYAFPAKTVYDPDNLDALIKDVYTVSPDATGFPTTHQAFAKSVVASFNQGTLLALAGCLLWIMLATRSARGFTLASLPLLIGGGWMLGLLSMAGIRYNYANIVALPLVIALAVDYGVWFAYRWEDLKDHTPLEVSLNAGKVIGLAAGTELAGLGAITLASYRGVSALGVNITIGLLCCLTATLVVAPAIGQLLDSKRNPK